MNKNKILVQIRAALALGRQADAIIIGAQKSGTSSLYRYLDLHPQVTTPDCREVHYFDDNHHRGARWYAANFSGKRGLVAVESSPIYLFHPLVPGRIANDLPSAKFLVLLRNPVDRAISHYQMQLRKSRETLTMKEALLCENDRIKESPFAFRNFSYRARGLYAEQIERWLALFCKDRFLFIIAEDMLSGPQVVFDRVCDFLGVKRRSDIDLSPRNTGIYSAPVSQEVRDYLGTFYRPHNARLARLLGRKLPWL